MSRGGLTFIVDDEKMVRALTRSAVLVELAIRESAQIVATSLAQEGGAVQPKIGEPWTVEGTNPMERHVKPPEDAWWAGFFAHGTAGHGPTSADALVFIIDGDFVRTGTVAGIAASHFDEKAIARAHIAVDLLIARAIQEAT